MKIFIRGVRGSIPTTGADTARYGGNTSCLVVSEQDHMLILDGGSGMQKFSLQQYTREKRLDILLTHLHLDHIQGLGFFDPFFNPALDVHIWGPASTHSLHARLSRYLSPPLFPVLLRDLPCKLTLHEISNTQFEIGPFRVQSNYVIHPGPTVGFRIIGSKSVFTYLPDHEPALGRTGLPKDPRWLSGSGLAKEADLLLHDAQYSAFEYAHRQGWGHSNMDDALSFAEVNGVKRLLLAHHDPLHTDQQLEDLLAELKSRREEKLQYELAAEGMEIELP